MRVDFGFLFLCREKMDFDYANLSAAINRVAHVAHGPFIHPGRSQPQQSPPPPPQPRAFPEPTAPPPSRAGPLLMPNLPASQHKIPTYLGCARKMQFSYLINGSRNREYHRVYDFDVSFESMGLDYIPFDGFFLALQHADKKFVAAHLLHNQRDILATIVQADQPRVINHGGMYYVHLDFSSAAGRNSCAGLPLLACRQDAFTIRVIVNDKTGTNFYLLTEGKNYDVMHEHVMRNCMASGFVGDIVWRGSRNIERVHFDGQRARFQNQKMQWHPQQSGQPTKPPPEPARQPPQHGQAVFVDVPQRPPRAPTPEYRSTAIGYDPLSPVVMTARPLDEYDPTAV